MVVAGIAVAIPQGSVLSQWALDPMTVSALLAAASAYGLGLSRVRRTGGSIARGPVIAWYLGLASLALAVVSPLDVYADVSFTVHMAQHLVLTLLAPPLLALGAPATLALRASSPRSARRLAAVFRGRVAAFLTRPVVGWLLFVSVPFFVHFSALFDAALRSVPVHAFEHGLWLGAALIYWWPIVGRDPSPHPVRYPVRLFSLFLAMPAMSFLAVAIYTADAPLYVGYAALPAPWGPEAFASQQNAAVMMWLVGNLGFVAAILIVAAAWKRDEDARQARVEAREDALASG